MGVGPSNFQFSMNNFQANTSNVAKKIAEESLEFLKSAKGQVVPETQTAAPAKMNPVAGPTKAEVELKNKIDTQSKQLLDKLEEELRQLRQKRQRQIQSYSSESLQETATQPTQVFLPQGKQRNVFGGIKQKLKQVAGKREMQKNVSG